MIPTHCSIEDGPAVDRNGPPQGSWAEVFPPGELAEGPGGEGPGEVASADVTCNTRSRVTSKQVTRERARQRFRLTETDLGMLQFLSRHRFATLDQLGRRFGRQNGHVRRRTSLMGQAGYIVGLPVRPFAPWVWLPTKEGMAVVGLGALPTPDYSPVTHDHTLGCVDLAIAYELAGVHVVAEREARSPALAERDWSLPGQGRSRMYPDLIALREGLEPEAIELELNAKTPTVWGHKLAAYAASEYRRVTYWLPDRSLSQRFAKVVDAEGLAHLVRIRRFEAGSQPQV
jgi:hypothetical protein